MFKNPFDSKTKSATKLVLVLFAVMQTLFMGYALVMNPHNENLISQITIGFVANNSVIFSCYFVMKPNPSPKENKPESE
jgi:hypothetical protein